MIHSKTSDANSAFSDTIKAEFEAKTIPGAFLLKYVPTEESSVKCELAFVGWRGAHSSRLYINKHDRIHFLHLIGKFHFSRNSR